MKFFGKFRRKMILDGKFKNYLLYAFGEIVLIVLGILIAWKINNLNEIRKNRIVELKIYESLYQELHTNLNVLDSAIVKYGNNTLMLKNTIKFIGTNQEDLTPEIKKLIVEIKNSNANLRNESLNSVNNTTKFEFIENIPLKELISKYPNEINIYKNQEVKINTIVENRLKPIIEKYISLIDMLPNDNKEYCELRVVGQQSDYYNLLNNREYQNSVIARLLQTEIQIENANKLRKKTETLAIQLKQELKLKAS